MSRTSAENLKLHIPLFPLPRLRFTNRLPRYKKRGKKGLTVTSQTLLPDLLTWVRTVYEKKLWLQSKVASVLLRGEGISH